MTRTLLTAIALVLGWTSSLLADADGWNFVPVRPETAAQFSSSQEDGKTLLTLSGGGNPVADGKWVKKVPVNAGEYVSFNAQYKTRNLNESPSRSVLATIVWLNAESKGSRDAVFPISSTA